jgi:hydroxymethylglutaryl-CoA lyase
MSTGVDLDLLVATGAWLAAQLHKDTASRVTKARTAV